MDREPQIYSRRGFIEITAAGVATMACGGTQTPELPTPTTIPEATPVKKRVFPTPTPVMDDPKDSLFFRVLPETWWTHSNWYRDFIARDVASPDALWYQGNNDQSYSPYQFLDEVIYRRLGIRTYFREQREFVAREYIRDYSVTGNCANVVFAGMSFRYPLTQHYEKFEGLPVTFNTKVGLLVGLVEPIVPRRLVDNNQIAAVKDWYEQWRTNPVYKREPYMVMMKRTSEGLWFRLAVGYSKNKIDGEYRVELVNPEDQHNPFVVPITSVERVLMKLPGTGERLKTLDFGLDKDPYKKLILDIVYPNTQVNYEIN